MPCPWPWITFFSKSSKKLSCLFFIGHFEKRKISREVNVPIKLGADSNCSEFIYLLCVFSTWSLWNCLKINKLVAEKNERDKKNKKSVDCVTMTMCCMRVEFQNVLCDEECFESNEIPASLASFTFRVSSECFRETSVIIDYLSCFIAGKKRESLFKFPSNTFNTWTCPCLSRLNATASLSNSRLFAYVHSSAAMD